MTEPMTWWCPSRPRHTLAPKERPHHVLDRVNAERWKCSYCHEEFVEGDHWFWKSVENEDVSLEDVLGVVGLTCAILSSNSKLRPLHALQLLGMNEPVIASKAAQCLLSISAYLVGHELHEADRYDLYEDVFSGGWITKKYVDKHLFKFY